MWCSTARFSLRTLTLALIRIESLSFGTLELFGTITLTSFGVEDLIRVGTATCLVGTLTVASILVEYIWSCTHLGHWTLALAGFLVEDIWFGTVLSSAADTVTCLEAECLPTRAILDPRADTLAKSFAEFEW